MAAILTKSSSSETEIKIPSSIDVLASGDSESKSYEVREIGAYSFQNSSSLNKVWLPITLTSIGDYAFGGCTDIKEIVSDIENVFKISSNVFSVDINPTAKVYIPMAVMMLIRQQIYPVVGQISRNSNPENGLRLRIQ